MARTRKEREMAQASTTYGKFKATVGSFVSWKTATALGGGLLKAHPQPIELR